MWTDISGGGMAGRQGLEPRYADPESAVLPLDDLPDSVSFYHRLPPQPFAASLGSSMPDWTGGSAGCPALRMIGAGFRRFDGQKRLPVLEMAIAIESRPLLVEFLQFLFCASLEFGLQRLLTFQHFGDDMVIVQLAEHAL